VVIRGAACGPISSKPVSCLIGSWRSDAKTPGSHHDFGKDILTKPAGNAPIYAYKFEANRISAEAEDSIPYWRDVGTIEAYY
jgi:ADP-glucose pyrophosphorylase